MDNLAQSDDDKIRDAILLALHKSYRTQKGKYLHMTVATIWQEARVQFACKREDIERELEYLEAKKWILQKKERTAGIPSGKFKRAPSIFVYYKLSSNGIDLFEVKGKYSKRDVDWQTNIFNVNVTNSTIQGPVIVGNENNNVITTYNTQEDITKILELINSKHDLEKKEKEELRILIQEELRDILNNPDPIKTNRLIAKIKDTGKLWLIPIVTQMAASYFLHLLNVPPEQQHIIRNTWLA